MPLFLLGPSRLRCHISGKPWAKQPILDCCQFLESLYWLVCVVSVVNSEDRVFPFNRNLWREFKHIYHKGPVTRAKQLHLTVKKAECFSSPTLHTFLFGWMHFKITSKLLKNNFLCAKLGSNCTCAPSYQKTKPTSSFCSSTCSVCWDWKS